MPMHTKMFLMISQEDDYGDLIHGTDPASAVEGHYAEMDAWCSPKDPELNEEFVLTVYEIPEHAQDEVTAAVEDLPAGDYTSTVTRLVARFPDILSTTINVVYTNAEGARASELRPLPDLFERLR
ncbi:hypothetical protein [Mesorhizobium sp. M0228]|uniref:hypothetical protein n=1 Tax=Mesorhizobium sp. M0228 TaxID=2956923 RepID=UPI003337DF5B